MSQAEQDQFAAGRKEGERWPYPRWTYLVRILWWLVWKTVWKLCWKRFPVLRVGILRLFGAKATGVGHIHGSVWVEMPFDVELGHDFALGPRVTLYNLGGIRLGNYVVISQDAYLCGGTHDYTDPTYPLLRKKITVGSYVWIGAGAFIGPGVTIGEGAVIGARAVVMKDVEPWMVVAGNPARVVKQRIMKGGHP